MGTLVPCDVLTCTGTETPTLCLVLTCTGGRYPSALPYAGMHRAGGTGPRLVLMCAVMEAPYLYPLQAFIGLETPYLCHVLQCTGAETPHLSHELTCTEVETPSLYPMLTGMAGTPSLHPCCRAYVRRGGVPFPPPCASVHMGREPFPNPLCRGANGWGTQVRSHQVAPYPSSVGPSGAVHRQNAWP